MSEAIVADAPPPIVDYEQSPRDSTSRALLVAGAIYGVGCFVYLTQRLIQWITGVDVNLPRYQTAAIASFGLLAQGAAAVALAATCAAALATPTDARLRRASIAAACLGVFWFVYGLLGSLWIVEAFRQGSSAVDVARWSVAAICREFNQAMLPALLAFATWRRREPQHVARLAWIALVTTCLLQCIAAAESFVGLSSASTVRVRGWPVKEAAACVGFLVVAGFVAFVRRPWRAIAALPLAMFLVDDAMQRGSRRFGLLTNAFTLNTVWQQLRELSLLMVVASSAIVGTLIFAVAGLPRPSGRDAGALTATIAAMSDEMLFLAPGDRSVLPHDPFKAIVAPRPIGWISTLGADGRPNLAPYSFFNGVSTSPPMVMFCSEGWKDSVRNASATREFVCNLATRALADRMNVTSGATDANEFELAGLATAPCRLVKPPRVSASPAALECRVVDVVRLRDADGRELNNWMTIGQVVGIHVARGCVRDGQFDMTRAGTIARCGYVADYLEATELLQMRRPG